MEAVFGLMIGFAVIGILFVIPVILLTRVSTVLREVEALTRRFGALEEALKRERAAPGDAKPEKPAANTPMSAPAPLAAAAVPGAPPGMPAAPKAPAPRPVPPVTVTVQSEPTSAERMMRKVWNWLVIGEEYQQPGVSWEYAAATNWLLRIGILVVLAGIAFFLKYSIEKGLMGPLGRVALS